MPSHVVFLELTPLSISGIGMAYCCLKKDQLSPSHLSDCLMLDCTLAKLLFIPVQSPGLIRYH